MRVGSAARETDERVQRELPPGGRRPGRRRGPPGAGRAGRVRVPREPRVGDGGPGRRGRGRPAERGPGGPGHAFAELLGLQDYSWISPQYLEADEAIIRGVPGIVRVG